MMHRCILSLNKIITGYYYLSIFKHKVTFFQHVKRKQFDRSYYLLMDKHLISTIEMKSLLVIHLSKLSFISSY